MSDDVAVRDGEILEGPPLRFAPKREQTIAEATHALGVAVRETGAYRVYTKVAVFVLDTLTC